MKITSANENMEISATNKQTLIKYFEYDCANILKVNSFGKYENLFLLYNENIKNSIALISLDLSNRENEQSNYLVQEINFGLENFFENFKPQQSEAQPHSQRSKPGYKILGVYNYLDRLYIISSLSSVFIIDLNFNTEAKEKKFCKLKFDLTDLDANVELCDYCTYGIANPKILFTGGIKESGKINTALISFDISTYKFEFNKIKDNNFIGRYRHGVFSENHYLYIIGGFTKVLSQEEINSMVDSDLQTFICEKIQLIKYDTLMENWSELEYNGVPPRLMIDPYIQIFSNKYLFSFSSFRFEKIWYLDIYTNVSKEIKLNNLTIPKNINIYNGFFYSEKEQSFIAFNPVYEFEANNDISLNTLSGKVAQVDQKQQVKERLGIKHQTFNFLIKYFYYEDSKDEKAENEEEEEAN